MLGDATQLGWMWWGNGLGHTGGGWRPYAGHWWKHPPAVTGNTDTGTRHADDEDIYLLTASAA